MAEFFDPFAQDGPRWFGVAAHRPFLADLAAGVLDWLGDAAPETLSDAVILLPNRRAARVFVQALADRADGRAVLLPQVRPLGDLEEDEPPFAPGELGLDLPPAIAPLTRRFELARLAARLSGEDLTPMGALGLADAVGALIESCGLEEVDLSEPGRLTALAADSDLALHWERSAGFLEAMAAAWPRRLAELGLSDPAWRRTRLLRLLAERWAEAPPDQPVLAAGSVGGAAVVADVLAAVARAPRGAVVLPGLDRDLPPDVWDQIDEQHPQSGLKRLLERAAVERGAVRPWFVPAGAGATHARGEARQRLLNEALRPAEATGDWRDAIAQVRREAADADRAADPIAQGLEGLSLLTARSEEPAAGAIALMMRETLETPGRTCALVTPDLGLARRVEARLARWGIVADSSAGRPLTRLPAGRLMALAARFMAAPTDPHGLLALLKHPAVRARAGEAGDRARDALERRVLRGPPQADWGRLARRIERVAGGDGRGRPRSEAAARAFDRDIERARALAGRMEALWDTAFAPFAASPEGTATPDAAAASLAALMEALAGGGVWAGPDGEAAAALASALIEGGGALPPLDPPAFVELVAGLLADQAVRVGGATHPRLRILGTLEGRLARADHMILAGLEEGVWPSAAATDPFLSRPMRARLGLPPPERRLGQAAQDFVQAAAADEVVLVHCERRGGQPAVRSRWLWRLEMLARGADRPDAPVTLPQARPPLDWQAALDAPPPGPPAFARRPAPRPPVERRPRSLYVTRIERWARDPYALYARHVLGLEEMDRPGASAEAMARGDALHKAIERLSLAHPDALPDDADARLEALILEELAAHGFEGPPMAREAPLARNAARWLADFERSRRAPGLRLLVEQQGELTFAAPGGAFTLKAYADRIEASPKGAAILDFKTGQAPSQKQVLAQYAPQLTLTAAILAAGGFAGADGPVAPRQLAYVRITGRAPPGQVIDVSRPSRTNSLTADQMAEAALDALKRRVARFDDPSAPYLSWTAPQFMGQRGGSYDRLARVWEWHVVGDGPEGGE